MAMGLAPGQHSAREGRDMDATLYENRQNGALGLGRVNSHHQAMETPVNRILRGVSTKYLQAYLAMLRIQRRPPAKLTPGPGAAMVSLCG